MEGPLNERNVNLQCRCGFCEDIRLGRNPNFNLCCPNFFLLRPDDFKFDCWSLADILLHDPTWTEAQDGDDYPKHYWTAETHPHLVKVRFAFSNRLLIQVFRTGMAMYKVYHGFTNSTAMCEEFLPVESFTEPDLRVANSARFLEIETLVQWMKRKNILNY